MWGEGSRGPLGHVWVQAWTDNDYLNLRAHLRALFDIISYSGRSPEELYLRSWNVCPSVRPSVRPSNCPSVNITCASPLEPLIGCFWNLVRMFPSEFRSVNKHGRRRPSLIFLVIASPQKLLHSFKWNMPIVYASTPSCASTEKIPVRRQIWPFGSRLELSAISHWQSYYRISSKTTGRIFFLCLGQNVPLNVYLCKYQNKIRSVEKHGHDGYLWFFL